MTGRVSDAPADVAGVDRDGADNAAVAMDFLLANAASGGWRRFLPGSSGLRLVGSLLGRPERLARRTADYAAGLAAVVTGRSEVAPDKRDRRFTEPAWQRSTMLHRTLQTYLLTAAAARQLLADAELKWRDAERLAFIVENLIEAAAPSNVPVLNPLAWKALIDTRGRSAVNGLRNLVSDLRSTPRVPSMVDPDAFEVGRTLAVSAGAVVHRAELFELIQYTPATDTVGTIPLLIIPPVINKYYLLDLAPGRSLIEYLVSQGISVFAVSWRNPGKAQAAAGFDAYGAAIIAALDVVAAISGQGQAHLLSLCSGGALAAMVAAHLAGTGQDHRIATFSLGVSVLDQTRAGLPAALADPRALKAAVAASAAKGYLDGNSLAEIFAWLRPGDLIWNYWVNNYLQGNKPPAFDILYWNADTTRMTAALHRDFIDTFATNKLATQGGTQLLGTAIDLQTVKADSYIVAGVNDHICPWQNCYRSTQLLGGHSRFVLSTAGHVASMVNPPTNPKATYRTNDDNPPDPQDWLAQAHTHQGSWWPDYAAWLTERTPDHIPAPPELGGTDHPVLEPAPGSYVREH